MGENEKELMAITQMQEWSVPAGITEAVTALQEITSEYNKIASQNLEMDGEAAEAASERLISDRNVLISASTAFEPVKSIVSLANGTIATAKTDYAALRYVDGTLDALRRQERRGRVGRRTDDR